MASNGQHQRANPTCVLWLPAGTQPPPELLASLDRRDLGWASADDGYGAMAEVLLRHHPESGQSAVLVLVRPTQLDLSGLVVDAIDRYCARVPVWRYDPSASPVLAAAQRRELATVFVRTEPREPIAPAARTKPEPQPEPRGIDLSPGAASILTEEELGMLLADRPGR